MPRSPASAGREPAAGAKPCSSPRRGGARGYARGERDPPSAAAERRARQGSQRRCRTGCAGGEARRLQRDRVFLVRPSGIVDPARRAPGPRPDATPVHRHQPRVPRRRERLVAMWMSSARAGRLRSPRDPRSGSGRVDVTEERQRLQAEAVGRCRGDRRRPLDGREVAARAAIVACRRGLERRVRSFCCASPGHDDVRQAPAGGAPRRTRRPAVGVGRSPVSLRRRARTRRQDERRRGDAAARSAAWKSGSRRLERLVQLLEVGARPSRRACPSAISTTT